jgi:hypothetical protein
MTKSADNNTMLAKRRWWQRVFRPRFSMRTMMILLTLFCIVTSFAGRWVYRSGMQ